MHRDHRIHRGENIPIVRLDGTLNNTAAKHCRSFCQRLANQIRNSRTLASFGSCNGLRHCVIVADLDQSELRTFKGTGRVESLVDW
mgnify:CR=1 FL=1